MMKTINIDPKQYTLFDYSQNPTPKDKYKLGDVVYKEETNEVGVIIQAHGRDEYRTDMFGNCCSSELVAATEDQILDIRPDLLVCHPDAIDADGLCLQCGSTGNL